MGCPAEQTIAQFVEGELDSVASDNIEAHIDGCPECRQAVAAAARGGIRSVLPAALQSGNRELPTATVTKSQKLIPGAAVGRYVVRRTVGVGGMGIVYAAYDPSLEREVALKILHPELGAFAGERLDREAKIMARLAHPNVITIHDVGIIGAQAYVAMELVTGETLGQKLRSSKPRGWRQVLALFLPAGHGLAAAHREGVIHRDFKPDNVLVGNDGRVRVTDFGLARVASERESPWPDKSSDVATAMAAGQLTRTGALLGTPAYMAPEQLRGDEASAQSDQFGFCIALYEALYGERPFAGSTVTALEEAMTRGAVRSLSGKAGPAWLRRIVLRGLHAAPEQRWPSMDALLDALGRDPADRRWRLAAAAAALLLAGSAVALARVQPRAQPCQGASQWLAGVWDDPHRQQVQTAFSATGAAYAGAAWRGVSQALDMYSQAWTRMHTEACQATHVRGEQSAELLDLRMQCLEKQRQELSALVAVYARADAEVVQRAVSVVPSPMNLRVCSDARELWQPTPLPRDPSQRLRIAELEQRLAALRVEHQAGHYQAALNAAGSASMDSITLGYAPLEAEAHLILGDIQQTQGEYAAAESSFYKALWAGETGKQDRIAAQAWRRLVYVVGYSQERPGESVRLLQHAEAALRRLGDDELERAALQSAAGSIDFAQGRYPQAQQRFETSRSLLERALGPDSLELVPVLHRLTLALEPLGMWAEAIALERRALSIREKHFGPEHPETADSRRRLAQHLLYNEYYAEALGLAQQALATYQRNHPTDDGHVATALLGVSEILLDMERGAEALPLATRALAVRSQHRDAWHTDVAEALSHHALALLQVGQTAQALSEALRAKEIFARTLGTGHVKYAWALADLGHVYSARGEHRRAHEAQQEALSTVSSSQLTDVWSIEKQRIEVGRAELALRDGRAALVTLVQAVQNLERGDPSAILLADGYFRLAEALVFTNQTGPRVKQLAHKALVIYRREPVGRAYRIAELERFIARHALATLEQLPPSAH